MSEIIQNPEFKRRYPRRNFFTQIGALIQGKYFLESSLELGEKGMLISTDIALKEGDQLVLSFFIPSGHCVITRAVVRYMNIKNKSARVGVEFTTVSFEDRRTLRDYISQRTDIEVSK